MADCKLAHFRGDLPSTFGCLAPVKFQVNIAYGNRPRNNKSEKKWGLIEIKGGRATAAL